jgi:bifunctional DNase/RNase
LPTNHNLKISSITPSSVGANSYILILQSLTSFNLSFPIVIGSQEAQSISIYMEGISISRPLTHDLIVSILNNAEIQIEYITISSFKDGVFIAEIVINVNSELKVIDARPSDAIAIAIRLQKEIRISTELLNSICIDSNQIDVENSNANETIHEVKSIIDLENELAIALNKEDYENAVQLRDQIEKLKLKNEK